MLKKVNALPDQVELRRCLARHLLQVKVGERLPGVRSIAASTGMSIGSVSQALRGIEEMGAVTIQRRGRLGSVVETRSLGELWNLAESDPLVIATSLPFHLRFEGLATAVKHLLMKAGIAAYLIFIRGSRVRLQALGEKRCHVALMSGLAAEELCTDADEIVLKLPPGSWVSDNVVFYTSSPPVSGRRLRVAVDQDSFDHQRLIELEFADWQNVELTRVSYMQLPRLLKTGEVDATVWTTDQLESFLGPGILYRPLSDRVMRLAGEKSTSAAFVIRKGSETVRAVVREALAPDAIIEIQRKVVAGEMIPEY